MMESSSERKLSRENRIVVLLALGVGFLGGIVGSTVVQRTPICERLGGCVSPQGTSTHPDVIHENRAVVDVVEHASPAVVAVIVSKDVPRLETLPFSPFDGLFGPLPLRLRRPTNDVERQEIGGGSGFVVDADGLLLTNRHVVIDEDAEYEVVFSSGERVSARVVARDPVLDLAVLRVEKSGLRAIELGNSQQVKAGQSVIAIGNALGEFPNSVSVGVISGVGRQIRAGDITTGDIEVLDEVLQTDAAINPGNSGGPLLDLSGRAIGVNVAVAGGAENIGFAIPIDEVARIIRDVKEQGRIVRPLLGVRYVQLTPALQTELKLSVSEGALIVAGENPPTPAVVPGSAAQKAGLKEGDIILEVDGTQVTRNHSLQSFLRAKRPGDTITLTVLSGSGERKTVRVTLEEAAQSE